MSNGNKPPPGVANILANALASRHDYGGKVVGAGVHNTLECRNCGAARERHGDEAAGGRPVCRYCGTALQ